MSDERCRESPTRELVVWADEASPFTGPQVKALLEENEALRKVAEAAKNWRRAWNEESGQALAEQGLCHALNALESSSTGEP